MYLAGFDATATILKALRSGDEADINDTDTESGKEVAIGSSTDTSTVDNQSNFNDNYL